MRYVIAATIVLMLMVAMGIGLSRGLGGSATASPLIPHTTVIAENLVIDAPAPSVTTAFIATEDCDRIVVFTDATANMVVRARPSVDGGAIDAFAFTGATSSKVAGQSVTYFSESIIAPEMSIEFERSNTAETAIINKAWLYCAH